MSDSDNVPDEFDILHAARCILWNKLIFMVCFVIDLLNRGYSWIIAIIQNWWQNGFAWKVSLFRL